MAQPCESFPALFSRGTIFDRFPFLLPNLVCAVILAFGVLFGVLFLEETHAERKGRRDLGIETRKWLVRRLRTRKLDQTVLEKAAEANFQENFALLEDEEPPGYRTTEGSPHKPSTPSCSPSALPADAKVKSSRRSNKKPRGFAKIFTTQVILNIAGFGLLAL